MKMSSRGVLYIRGAYKGGQGAYESLGEGRRGVIPRLGYANYSHMSP